MRTYGFYNTRRNTANVPSVPWEMEAGSGQTRDSQRDNHNNRTLHSVALSDFQYVQRRVVPGEKRSSMTHNGKLNAEKSNKKNEKKI